MAQQEFSHLLDRLNALFEQVDEVLDEPNRIKAARKVLSEHVGDEAIQAMVTECGQILGSDFCAMTLLDDTTQHIVAASVPLESCAREHSYCQFVIASGEPMVINDSRQSFYLLRQPRVRGVSAYLGVPVLTPDGERLGALCAVQSQPRKWTDADRELLEGYSQRITDLLKDTQT